MEKHTPGPWKYADEEVRQEFPGASRVCWTGTRATYGTGFDLKTTEANAALISAAPDMLEALKLLREAIHALHLLDIKKRFSLCVADAAAGKAIFKAEGR